MPESFSSSLVVPAAAVAVVSTAAGASVLGASVIGAAVVVPSVVVSVSSPLAYRAMPFKEHCA
jgi:hypothetical protein